MIPSLKTVGNLPKVGSEVFALDRYLETARAMAAVSRDQHLGGPTVGTPRALGVEMIR